MDPETSRFLGVYPDMCGPATDVGNGSNTFGITYGWGEGSGHCGLVWRAMPDRPWSRWPAVWYDEVERQGQTFGGDAFLSAYLLFTVLDTDGRAPWPSAIEEIRGEREDLVAFAAYHGDDRMAQTIDALLAGVSYPELVELVDPGSVRARAARLPRDAPVEDWLALADADPRWLPPLLRAFERDASLAERVLRAHHAFDSPHGTLERAAAALLAQGRTDSPFWPVALASGDQQALSLAFLEAARTLGPTEPLAALDAAANALWLCEDERWSEEAWDLIVRNARAAVPDYRRWLAELYGAQHPLLGLLRSEPAPPTLPTPEQLATAPLAVAVAWDRVSGVPVVPCEPALAHLRAERLGLDWSDPVQRAIAERAADEADILAILRHGP